MPGELVSLREFARRVGVSPNAVTKALKGGRIKRNDDGLIDWDTQSKAWAKKLDASKVRDNASAAGKAAVSKVYKPKAKSKKKPAPSPEPAADPVQDLDEDEDEIEDGDGEESLEDDLELNRERARKERAAAILKQMDVRERRGQLVRQSDVKHAMVRFAVELRDAVLDIPDRVASGIAGELAALLPPGSIDGHELERIILDHWNREAADALGKLKRVHG